MITNISGSRALVLATRLAGQLAAEPDGPTGRHALTDANRERECHAFVYHHATSHRASVWETTKRRLRRMVGVA